MQFKHLFSITLLLLGVCGIQKEKQKEIAIDTDTTRIETKNRTDKVKKCCSIEDTMVLKGIDDLMKTPDSQGERIVRLERCTVSVLNKKTIPNIERNNVVDSFVKVRTTNGDTGYLWREVLVTKSQLKAHNDSLSMWSKLSMPSYNHLIGTTYYKNSELPIELGSGAFISVGEDSRYGIISVYNKYTYNYSYMFFVRDTGHDSEGNNGLLILDIAPLDWRSFGPGASLMMRQCECIDASKDCSEVVAVYAHTEEQAKKGILATPERAWRPDYLTKKLMEIPVESVKCGSQAPEEYDEDEFPG